MFQVRHLSSTSPQIRFDDHHRAPVNLRLMGSILSMGDLRAAPPSLQGDPQPVRGEFWEVLIHLQSGWGDVGAAHVRTVLYTSIPYHHWAVHTDSANNGSGHP